MKQFFALFFFPVCLFMGALNAQVCTPDPGVTSGISPTSSNVACANKGQAFSQVFTFAIPSTVGGFATVSSVTFDSIRNLPSGFTYAFNQTPASYAGGATGCVTISGTTNAACGQYKMLIYVTVVTNLLTTPSTELSALATQYNLVGFDPIYLRLKETAGTCPAVNANGQNFTADQSCGIAGGIASATTTAATNVGLNVATLNGIVNANSNAATVTFEYGLTASYGSTVTATQSPVAGTTNTNVSAAVSGLTANTTYHFRVKAVNSGGTANGSDLIFTTLAPAGSCTPNPNQTTAFEPAPEDFQCAIKGSPYNETIFLNFGAVNAQVPFDSVRIDSLGNLPSGIVGLTNQSDKTYSSNEYGCFQFSGTTNAACGQYKVKMYITIWTTLAGKQTGELSALAALFGVQIPTYFVRVASCAGACPDVDPSAGDFEPNANCPVPGVITAPTISGATTFCSGSSTTLSASANYLSYKWSNGALTQNTTVTSANTYTVTVSNGCDTSTASATVTAGTAPNTTLTQSGNTLSVPNVPNAVYQWLKDGAVVNNATGSSYTPTVSGNYTVDVTLGNCRDTSNAIQITISSVESVSGISYINVMPNPAKTHINIDLKATESVTDLKVMDMYGKTLKDIPVNSSVVKEKIQIEELPSGIYFIQIATTKGKVTHSFIKQ